MSECSLNLARKKLRPLGWRIYLNRSVSWQDTVVALQALAMFSAKTAGNSLDLKVKLT